MDDQYCWLSLMSPRISSLVDHFYLPEPAMSKGQPQNGAASSRTHVLNHAILPEVATLNSEADEKLQGDDITTTKPKSLENEIETPKITKRHSKGENNAFLFQRGSIAALSKLPLLYEFHD